MPVANLIDLSAVRLPHIRNAVFSGERFTGKDWSQPADPKSVAIPLHLASGVRLSIDDLNQDEIRLVKEAADGFHLDSKNGFIDAIVSVKQKSRLRLSSEELACDAIDSVAVEGAPFKMLSALPIGALASAGFFADNFRRAFVDAFDGDERNALIEKIENVYRDIRSPELATLTQQWSQKHPADVEQKRSSLRR